MQRRDHHGRAQPGPAGARRRGGGEGEGLGEVAVVEPVVLGEPERMRAEPVGFLAGFEGERVQARRVLPPRRGIAQVEVQADVHRRFSVIS